MSDQNKSGLEPISITPEKCEAAPGSDCLERRPDPCNIVIFGASGDLTARKLIPALFNLFGNEGMPEFFNIVGVARTEMTSENFRLKMRQALRSQEIDLEKWPVFSEHLHYLQVIYDDDESYKSLALFLDDLNIKCGIKGNTIFNLAIPPTMYKTVVEKLGAGGLSQKTASADSRARLVVEKPFGWDLESARDLNRVISDNFHEDQVFRIDHYMAKETVQNIMMFRFANSIFEPLWNRNYVDYVCIAAAETLGVEHRAGYYDRFGVLRDMMQNHMMQLLALVATESPPQFEADLVRDEKVKVFRSLRPFPLENKYDFIVLGQYGAGRKNGEKLSAYRDEAGIDPESLTPTFSAIKIFLDNWRWQGVPFYLVSGKRLAKKSTRIEIQFKQTPHSLFRNVIGDHIAPNRLILCIQPNESIILTFQSKTPGRKTGLRPVTMDFNYQQGYSGPILDAYEKALADTMLGDHMLFWRQDGLEQCWEFFDPIINECEQCRAREGNLHIYKAGGHGPEAAFRLLPAEFRKGI